MIDFLKSLHFKRDPRLIVFAIVLVLTMGALIAHGDVEAKQGLAMLAAALALPGLFGSRETDDDETPLPNAPPPPGRKPPTSLRRVALALGVGSLTFALATTEPACHRPITPNDVEAGIDITDATCSWLEGITENKTVISICATVDEIAQIAALFTPFLSREGAADAECTTLPKTSVCLTPMQVGKGIQAVLATRRARLLIDAGAR